jgi:hypothetical protein
MPVAVFYSHFSKSMLLWAAKFLRMEQPGNRHSDEKFFQYIAACHVYE